MCLIGKFIFAASTFIVLCVVGIARADAVTVYMDRAAFNAASTGLTTITFEGIVGIGQSIDVLTPPGLTLSGVNFSSVTGNLIVAGPLVYLPTSALASNGITNLLITLPTGNSALGMDFSLAGNPAPQLISFILPTGETFPRIIAGTVPLSLEFFGITSPVPLSSISIISMNPTSTLVIDNVSFGRSAIPEPPAILFFAAGLTGVALVRLRGKKRVGSFIDGGVPNLKLANDPTGKLE
jgi:hypothetical protein